MPLLFLILISSFNYINLQANDDKFKCKKEDVNREIEIGDEVTLCIHSKELNQKIAYKLKVDKYSIITIKGGFKGIIPEDKSESEGNQNTRLRNLIYEPNSEDKEEILEKSDKKSNKEIQFSNIINRYYSNGLTQGDDEVGEGGGEAGGDGDDDVEDDYGAKVFAQIGDKITQYPSVSNIFIIFIYFFRLIVNEIIKL